jgi:hypothetical protein
VVESKGVGRAMEPVSPAKVVICIPRVKLSAVGLAMLVIVTEDRELAGSFSASLKMA